MRVGRQAFFGLATFFFPQRRVGHEQPDGGFHRRRVRLENGEGRVLCGSDRLRKARGVHGEWSGNIKDLLLRLLALSIAESDDRGAGKIWKKAKVLFSA